MVYVLTHFSGIYVFDENLNLKEKVPVEFTKEELELIREGKLTDKEKEIFEKLKEKYGELIYLGYKEGLKRDEDSKKIEKALEIIRKEVKKDILLKEQEIMVSLTREDISKHVTSDLLIIQAISALDDLNKIINLMVERLREWYNLYCPEVSMAIEDHEEFVSKIIEKDREELMKELGIKETMGGKLSQEEIKMIRDYAKRIKDLYELRKELADYIRKMMEKVCPNLTAIAGPLVGARLLSLAGGLKELAMLPASTIQVLGAEKALFRHLQKGTPPPKHGVLFQHPLVSRLPKKLRGRMARTLAAKIAIAAKVDAFSPGKYIADQLKKEIEERFNELRQAKK